MADIRIDVTYVKDSTDTSFALAGDEKTVEDNNVQLVNTDLGENRVKNPGTEKTNQIQRWAYDGIKPGEDEGTKLDENGNPIKDSEDLDDDKNLKDKKNEELAGGVSIAGALAALTFGTVCFANATTRLPQTGLVAAKDDLNAAAAAKEGMEAIALSAIFDPEFAKRIEYADYVEDQISTVKEYQDMMDDDYGQMQEIIEQENALLDYITGTKAKNGGSLPDEEQGKVETAQTYLNDTHVGAVESITANAEEAGEAYEIYEGNADFLQSGNVVGGIAEVNAALLGATSALDFVMSPKAKLAGSRHATEAETLSGLAAVAASFGQADKALALKIASVVEKIAATADFTAAAAFTSAGVEMATAGAVTAGIGVGEFLTASKGGDLADASDGFKAVIDAQLQNIENFKPKDDGGGEGDGGTGSGTGGGTGGDGGTGGGSTGGTGGTGGAGGSGGSGGSGGGSGSGGSGNV